MLRSPLIIGFEGLSENNITLIAQGLLFIHVIPYHINPIVFLSRFPYYLFAYHDANYSDADPDESR